MIGFYFNLKKVTGLQGRKYDEKTLVEEIVKKNESYLYNKVITSQLMTADTLNTTNLLLEKLEIDLGASK